jgi:hypothetical protein
MAMVSMKCLDQVIEFLIGVKNTIMYGDSSMIIQDYPSIKWDEFHELQNLIKK